MPQLIAPTERLAASFSEAVDEFIAEGRGGPDDRTLTGQMIRDYVLPSERAGWIAAYLADERRWETVPPANFVPMTMLWWVDGDTYLARISIRHRLNDRLRDVGGHIGYDVRPSARRRGHATAMLAAALPRAAAFGIDKALITCDTDNIGSRKVIERNGGVFEDQRGKKLRFWVATTPVNRVEGGELSNAQARRLRPRPIRARVGYRAYPRALRRRSDRPNPPTVCARPNATCRSLPGVASQVWLSGLTRPVL